MPSHVQTFARRFIIASTRAGIAAQTPPTPSHIFAHPLTALYASLGCVGWAGVELAVA